jgi:hypothetical protein
MTTAPRELTQAPSGRKLTVKVELFKPLRSNTLFGFADIVIPEMRLRILDATVHESHGKRWVGLPAKLQITRDRSVRLDQRGKVVYSPVLEFTDRATRDAFSARVIDALLEDFPGAFEDRSAA